MRHIHFYMEIFLRDIPDYSWVLRESSQIMSYVGLQFYKLKLAQKKEFYDRNLTKLNEPEIFRVESKLSQKKTLIPSR